MEIIEACGIYDGPDDDANFVKTKIVFQFGNKCYIGSLSFPFTLTCGKSPPHSLKWDQVISPKAVELSMYPQYSEPNFGPIAPDGETSVRYFKRPSLLDFDVQRPNQMSNYMCAEGRVLRALYYNPHPNLVSFKGCLVRENYVVGFSMKRCDIGLRELVTNPTRSVSFVKLTVSKIVEQLRSALNHLHALGFSHNDVTIENVMLEDDCAVLIDYDSSSRIGEKPMKCTWPILRNGGSVESDLESLERLKDLLAKYLHSF